MIIWGLLVLVLEDELVTVAVPGGEHSGEIGHHLVYQLLAVVAVEDQRDALEEPRGEHRRGGGIVQAFHLDAVVGAARDGDVKDDGGGERTDGRGGNREGHYIGCGRAVEISGCVGSVTSTA